MISVNEGIGTSVPEKLENGRGDTWCFISRGGTFERGGGRKI